MHLKVPKDRPRQGHLRTTGSGTKSEGFPQRVAKLAAKEGPTNIARPKSGRTLAVNQMVTAQGTTWNSRLA